MNTNTKTSPVPTAPQFLYRYLEKQEHALRMLDGFVWVSTLKTVRTHPATGDAKDSTLSYTVTGIGPNTSKEDEATALARLAQGGIIISPGNLVSDVSSDMTHPDAFVLCLSMAGNNKKLRRIFGEYCVRIAEPERFRQLLTEELHRQRSIRSFTFGTVLYNGRAYVDAAPLVGAIGFASTQENAIEKEARIIWNQVDQAQPIAGIELHVPAVAGLCSIVEFF